MSPGSDRRRGTAYPVGDHGSHPFAGQCRHRVEAHGAATPLWTLRLEATSELVWQSGLRFPCRAGRDLCGWLLLARLSDSLPASPDQPCFLAGKDRAQSGAGSSCRPRFARTRVAGAAHPGMPSLKQARPWNALPNCEETGSHAAQTPLARTEMGCSCSAPSFIFPHGRNASIPLRQDMTPCAARTQPRS